MRWSKSGWSEAKERRKERERVELEPVWVRPVFYLGMGAKRQTRKRNWRAVAATAATAASYLFFFLQFCCFLLQSLVIEREGGEGEDGRTVFQQNVNSFLQENFFLSLVQKKTVSVLSFSGSMNYAISHIQPRSA